jgi:hypothetical protein
MCNNDRDDSSQTSETTRQSPLFSRRQLLGTASAVGGSLLAGKLLATERGQPRQSPAEPKFLIVLACTGGASAIDGPLAIRASESKNASTIHCFEDSLVQNIDGTDLRAVNQDLSALGPIPIPVKARHGQYVQKLSQDMMVATWTRTSVNHAVGQRRSVTGNGALHGRTLQEAVALTHGKQFVLPNVHLVAGTSYTDRGTDDTLPPWAYGETVVDPGTWPLSLSAQRGILDVPSPSLLAKARALRNNKLDTQSLFSRVFGTAPRLQHWQHMRGTPQQALEAQDLISKLMVRPDSPDFPLSAYGLGSSPDADKVRNAFPNYATDPLHAQAALAFLLLKYRLSVTVTLGPTFATVVEDGVDLTGAYGLGGGGGGGKKLTEGSIDNPPIAFDFSHQAHRAVQGLMWERVYAVADGLIELLKQEEWAGGGSMWDRSMIYFATEFGRSKPRPENAKEFATGHDLNNAAVVLSPMVPGGKVLGGVDPDTALTYGFDPNTGVADKGREMTEPDIYAGLAHTLGVDTTGSDLPDMRAMRKKA